MAFPEGAGNGVDVFITGDDFEQPASLAVDSEGGDLVGRDPDLARARVITGRSAPPPGVNPGASV